LTPLQLQLVSLVFFYGLAELFIIRLVRKHSIRMIVLAAITVSWSISIYMTWDRHAAANLAGLGVWATVVAIRSYFRGTKPKAPNKKHIASFDCYSSS